MKALWIKKTVYRRYLIEENDIDEVKALLQTVEHIDLIEDVYDKSKNIEYDEETIIVPYDYEFQDIRDSQ